MHTPVVGQLVTLLDEAFAGTRWHSLLTNLRPVTPDDWLWVPPGGERSIRDIVLHVGTGKLLWHNHAFADGQLDWDDTRVASHDRVETVTEAVRWLREGHDALRRSIAALDDRDLPLPRRTHWGEARETRWIIAVVMEHDLYHAGEINHIRSLRRRADDWGHEPE